MPLSHFVGYDDLRLISAALSEACQACLRHGEEARRAGDIYKAASEFRRAGKYRKLLDAVNNAMIIADKSGASAKIIPIVPSHEDSPEAPPGGTLVPRVITLHPVSSNHKSLE
jgi:hypothetical protein